MIIDIEIPTIPDESDIIQDDPKDIHEKYSTSRGLGGWLTADLACDGLLWRRLLNLRKRRVLLEALLDT